MADNSPEIKKQDAKLPDPKILLEALKRVKVVDIDYPVLDPRNPRDHSSARQRRVLQSSLERHGQVTPIIVNSKTREVIGGNGTLTVMREMGFTQVMVIEHEKGERDHEELRDLLNRSAELSEWDYEKLASAVKRYMQDNDMPALGWEEFELGPILAAQWSAPPLGELPGGDGVPPPMGDPIDVTLEQRQVIEQACEALRIREKDPNITEGRCLELICADFLAGA